MTAIPHEEVAHTAAHPAQCRWCLANMGAKVVVAPDTPAAAFCSWSCSNAWRIAGDEIDEDIARMYIGRYVKKMTNK